MHTRHRHPIRKRRIAIQVQSEDGSEVGERGTAMTRHASVRVRVSDQGAGREKVIKHEGNMWAAAAARSVKTVGQSHHDKGGRERTVERRKKIEREREREHRIR